MKRVMIVTALVVCSSCGTEAKSDPTIVVNNNNGNNANCAQIGGEYQTSEYRDGADCGWESEEDDYVMTVAQTGCNVDVTLASGRTATGIVGANTVSVTMTFQEEGGEFTATNQPLSINGNVLQGTLGFVYEADDGSQTCTYEVTLTATKTSTQNNVNNVNNTSQLTLEQSVVGAWGASGNCGGDDVQAGIFLCPGGRVRGARTFGNFDFLVCGTWTATEPDQVDGYEKFIAVADPNDPANNDIVDVSYTFDRAGDTLTWNGPCAVPLERLKGGTTEADCESPVCSDGGSGPVECGTDCDCGRCNYCESLPDRRDGICRYGGEGPFGCYRGCGE